MTSRGIHRLQIVRDGKLVGVVSRSDLVKAPARSI
jgi:CBS domain-containing protein